MPPVLRSHTKRTTPAPKTSTPKVLKRRTGRVVKPSMKPANTQATPQMSSTKASALGKMVMPRTSQQPLTGAGSVESLPYLKETFLVSDEAMAEVDRHIKQEKARDRADTKMYISPETDGEDTIMQDVPQTPPWTPSPLPEHQVDQGSRPSMRPSCLLPRKTRRTTAPAAASTTSASSSSAAVLHVLIQSASAPVLCRTTLLSARTPKSAVVLH
jgi:hypothetical protein